MPGPNSLSVDKLSRLIGTPAAPLVLDVRIADDFNLDPRLLPCARKASHETAADSFALGHVGTRVVVCQHGAKLSQGVAALLRLRGCDAVSLDGGFDAWRAAGLPLVPISAALGLGTDRPTRWVTRQRPKIDRIACPWLVRRFVDARAEFLFVPSEDVEGVAQRFGATPFDMPSGPWTHVGDRCSFDAMVDGFGLATPALMHMARIVRAADTGNLADVPEASGLLAISLGLSRQHSDDNTQLDAGMMVYDALYRWCRDAVGETHSWTKHPTASEA
jgi:rhodanese-related sulfurtransferase